MNPDIKKRRDLLEKLYLSALAHNRPKLANRFKAKFDSIEQKEKERIEKRNMYKK